MENLLTGRGVGKGEYRYLVRREREEERYGQKALLEKFSYYVVVTNHKGKVESLMKTHGGVEEPRREGAGNLLMSSAAWGFHG